MEKFLLYKDWLDTFRREVETEMERMRKAPAAPAPAAVTPKEEAVESLRSWWEKSYEDPTDAGAELAALEGNRELELSRKEVAILKAELDRVQQEKGESLPAIHSRVRDLVGEKAKLEEQLSLALKEIAGLKEYRELSKTVEQELGGLRLRMTAIRGEYEGRMKVLRDQAESAERRAAAFEAETKNERERRFEAERASEEHRHRVAEAEALRAELKAVQAQVETRLSTAAEFLEMKIRSVQDQSKGQGAQLKELVEALRRLREG